MKAFEKKKTEGTEERADAGGAVPAYLLDRKDRTEGKALSQQVKQKRQDKAAKFNVPIPKVRMQSENEVFRQVKSGKRGKSWKRMVTKVLGGYIYISLVFEVPQGISPIMLSSSHFYF